MIEIPEQLRKKDFRFIKVGRGAKIPVELGWALNELQWEQQPDQSWKNRLTNKLYEYPEGKDNGNTIKKIYYGNKKNYAFDDAELVEWIKAGNNYGVCGGFGNLAGIDADDKRIQKLIEDNFKETLTGQSGSPDKKHYYVLLSEALEKTIPLINYSTKENKNIGHIRWLGGMLVGINCIHPNGNQYKMKLDKPIATFDTKKLLEVLAPYIKSPHKKTTHNTEKPHAFAGINIADIVSLDGLEEKGSGELQGGHPLHPSETGWDFEIDPTTNQWHCFGHSSGGSIGELIAVKHGILQCSECQPECLRGEKFKQVVAIAKEKYGLKEKVQEKKSEPATHNELIVRSLHDFAKMKKEKTAIVEEWILPLTIIMLFAAPKNFKSLLANYLGLCLATGKKFLNLKTKKIGVLLIDNENNKNFLRDRLLGICTPLKIKKTKRLPFYVATGLDLLNHNCMEQIVAFVKEKKIGFVIVDTLRRCGNFDENSSNDINRIFKEIFHPIRACGCTTLFLHHSGKSYIKGRPQYRGSSDLLGSVDAAFYMERKTMRKQTDNEFVLICTHSRAGEPDAIHATISFNGEQIAFERNEEAAEEEAREQYSKFQLARAFILDFAKAECPTENHSFKRDALLIALQAWNAERPERDRISKRLIDSTLLHLTKKILRKGDKRGEYYVNNIQNEQIAKWISPIGQGNALNPTTLQQPKDKEVA